MNSFGPGLGTLGSLDQWPRFSESFRGPLEQTDVRRRLDNCGLFLIAQDRFMTINGVALGLSGSDSGSTRTRWGNALNSLKGKNLIVLGGSGRTARRANVEGFISNGLAAHSPSEAEVKEVVNRALWTLGGGK